jgi:hypothetical protein
VTCSICGLDNPPNARFCGHCGAAQTPVPQRPPSVNYPVTVSDPSAVNDPNTITIPFHGTYVSSPNGLFTFGWGLALAAQRVLCMKNGQILWQKDLTRVNGGAVTDNGWSAAFAFSPSRFCVFDPAGELFFEQGLEDRFFINACGLNPDEMFAWCSSSAKLAVFSLLSRTRVLDTDRPRWPVTRIAQAVDQIQIETGQATYLYATSGELLNKADIETAWERFVVARGNPTDTLAIANQHLQLTPPERMPPAEREFVIGMLRHLVDVIPPRTHDRARSNRLLEDVALACGDKSAALQHFRAALGDDAKIGVMAMVKRLEKEAGQ